MELKIDNLTPEQIDAIKAQIAEYEKENENQKPKDVIDFDNGWIVSLENVVSVKGYFGISIRTIYSQGLYRDTKEEAEKLLRKMQIEHRLRQWAKTCKEKVDFKESQQTRYFIYYDLVDEVVSIDGIRDFQCIDIYFTDKSILQRAIADIGEQNLIDNYFVEV